MSSMNVVVLVGRLTKDPEIRYTGSQTAVCNFSIAIDDGFGQQKKTHYFDVIAWQKTAETVHKYVQKGHLIGIEGRLTQEVWEDRQTGQKRSAVKVTANTIRLMQPRSNSNGQPGGQQDYDDLAAVGTEPEQMPF